MNQRFDVKILDEVFEFFDEIEEKAVEKILFNKKKYRVLAFWDKSDKKETFVIGTNGFIKKTKKTPKKEILKAKRIMKLYFEQKKTKR